MKHKIFAVSELVAFVFAPWRALALFPFVVTLLTDTTELIPFSLFIFFFAISIPIFIYRNALDIVQIDAEGIKNKKVKLKWYEICHTEICMVELYKHNFGPTKQIDILQLSVDKEPPSFYKSNKRCVFISITEKNVRLVAEYAKGKSPVLEKCLERFL